MGVFHCLELAEGGEGKTASEFAVFLVHAHL